MINWFKKRSAINSYVKVLPHYLKKKHGKHKKYSAEQVMGCIRELDLSSKYINYALAAYISEVEFNELLKFDSGNFHSLRKEISDKYFDGASKFSIHDTLEIAKNNLTNESNQVLDNSVEDDNED